MAEEFSWNFPKYMYIVRDGFSENQEISAKSRLNFREVSLIDVVSVSSIYEKFGKNSRTDMLIAGNNSVLPRIACNYSIQGNDTKLRNFTITVITVIDGMIVFNCIPCIFYN